jgi:hypothetical protein
VIADLPSILTHEVGHFLGLAHSSDGLATMRPGYNPGDIELRTLDTDDIAGICDIYDAAAGERSPSCEPRHGFSRECASTETGCCALQGTRPRSDLPLLAMLGGLLLAALRRRRPKEAAGLGAGR